MASTGSAVGLWPNQCESWHYMCAAFTTLSGMARLASLIINGV